MEKVIFTRQELYELVWKEPLSHLSKKYQISDVGLRKICIRMNIPTPPMGHWLKVKYGKQSNKIPLPKNFNGNSKVNLSLADEELVKSQSPLLYLIKEIENDSSLPLKVPQKLSTNDPLILKARDTLLYKKLNYHSEYKGIVQTASGELNIRVSPANVSRALRIMETFLKIVRARGHDVALEYGDIRVIMYAEDIEFSIKEKFKIVRAQDRWGESREYHPNGILSFRRECVFKKEWVDGKKLLEDQLVKIIAYFELESKRLAESHLQQEEQRRIREEEKRKAQELQARKDKEFADVRSLINQANNWHQSEILRNYLNILEHHAMIKSGLTDELKAYIAWARHKADWIDPLTEVNDELLGEKDFNTS